MQTFGASLVSMGLGIGFTISMSRFLILHERNTRLLDFINVLLQVLIGVLCINVVSTVHIPYLFSVPRRPLFYAPFVHADPRFSRRVRLCQR